VEFHGDGERVTLNAGEKSWDLHYHDGILTFDGFDLAKMIERQFDAKSFNRI